jgi:cytochrome c biogenesis protein CcmG/thiol:disulfide interchange protein DsbE
MSHYPCLVSARSFVAFLAVLGLVGLLGFGLLSKGSASIEIGEPAPDGTLPRLNGDGSGSVADYRGSWVLVNFWASWCVPCQEESPALEAFYREHGGRNFTVLGIDTRDLTDDGLAFVKRYGVSYPQLRDGDGARSDDFGTTGVPESFLVDPRGRLALIRRGPVDEDYLDRYVAPLLGDERESG